MHRKHQADQNANWIAEIIRLTPVPPTGKFFFSFDAIRIIYSLYQHYPGSAYPKGFYDCNYNGTWSLV